MISLLTSTPKGTIKLLNDIADLILICDIRFDMEVDISEKENQNKSNLD